MRFFDSLRPPNLRRSDDTYRRIRAILFPNMHVPADDIGPLAAGRAKRPGAREAWAAAAAVNTRRSLVTRGRRMMTADDVPCKDDEEARKYVMTHLRRLAAVARRTNTVALGLYKSNGQPDLMTYSLGGGREYLPRFRRASEAQKQVWRRVIREAAKAARLKGAVKGAKQSKAVVTERAADMGLGENGYMAYRLGAACFFLLVESMHTVASQYATDAP